MEFYQLKITRKGTKPPVWRRCLVPADTDFAKLAAMLEDILEYADTENYEFEFFQKKLRLQNLEAQTAEATKGSYEYAEAKGRQIAELLDTEAWFTFRVKGMELPEYRTDIEKKITDEEKAGTPEILKETRSAEDDFWTADMQTKNTELEKKYGLHDAERRNRRLDTPLSKVDASAGEVKKQVGNTLKALNGQYRFQTMGEYRALLSIYNLTVEEARGNVRGREYHGLVYSVTDGRGNKVGNPFKSSLFGKSAGYEAMQKKFVRSRSEIKDRKLADMTKRTVLSVLQGTYDKDRFVSQLKEKGIDTVLRYTEEGRIYGATFIDHRTGCVLNGSRMGKELSANTLQEHFTLPYAGQPPIPLSIPVDAVDKAHGQTAYNGADVSGGMGLLTPEGPATDAEEEAFIRAMKRKKKKKRKGLGL